MYIGCIVSYVYSQPWRRGQKKKKKKKKRVIITRIMNKHRRRSFAFLFSTCCHSGCGFWHHSSLNVIKDQREKECISRGALHCCYCSILLIFPKKSTYLLSPLLLGANRSLLRGVVRVGSLLCVSLSPPHTYYCCAWRSARSPLHPDLHTTGDSISYSRSTIPVVVGSF